MFWLSIVVALLVRSVYGLLLLPLGLMLLVFFIGKVFLLTPADDWVIAIRCRVMRYTWVVVAAGIVIIAFSVYGMSKDG